MRTDELARAVIQTLGARGMHLATAESCTGGLIGKLLTDVAGASAVYMGGVISYVNDVKRRLLGVREETLRAYTAVSRQTAHDIALDTEGFSFCRELHLCGDRAQIREAAACAVLEMILEYLS